MLSLILPTYKEAENIRTLVPALEEVLRQIPHEIIIVDDDSPDFTWRIATEMAQKIPALHVIRRVGRRGLSSAVTEGFDAAKGDVLMVMDADGQHDSSIIPQLYEAIRAGATIAVASRYRAGGDMGGWSGIRPLMSKTATFFARKLPAVEVSDPMSGFFALDREAYRAIASQLRPTGFKILLEVLAFLPRGSKTAEVPLHFGMRKHGESKLSAAVQLQFISQLLRIIAHRFWWLPWALFALIAAIILFAVAPRIIALLPVYTDEAVRTRLASALHTVSAREGIVLSDLEIQRVEGDDVLLRQRVHGRGTDDRYCLRLSLADASTQPCDE